MSGGPSTFREAAGPVFRKPPRGAIPTSWFIAVIAIAIAAPLVVAGVLLEFHPAPPEFPSGGGGSVLMSDQAQGVTAVFEKEFTVPARSGSSVPVKVEEVALVNVSCGGASYFAGDDYECTMSLVSGSTGGPTENLLWANSFTGVVAWNVSLLLPGPYTLLVHVDIGTPPAAVVISSFNVAVEVLALS
jgi:hypothetical protein